MTQFAVYPQALLVALLWGLTNPLISRAARQRATSTNKAGPEVASWLANPLYIGSVAVNLTGSLVFFHLLRDAGTPR